MAAGSQLFVSNLRDGELWRSDGTEAGTWQVKDIDPEGGSRPEELTAVGDQLLFTAFDPSAGREIWRSDGTEAGTVRVQDLVPGSLSSYATQFTVSGSRVFFTADDTVTGEELWALPLSCVSSYTK